MLSPGQSAGVHVGAQSEVQQPQTLTWTATAPSGVQLTPSSGTINLGPGAQATQPATVSIAAGTPNGTYPVHITFTGNAGRQVASADLVLTSPQAYCQTHLCTTDSQGNLNNVYGCSGTEYNNPNLPVAKVMNGCAAASGSTSTPTRNSPGTMAGHTASAPGRRSAYRPAIKMRRTSR